MSITPDEMSGHALKLHSAGMPTMRGVRLWYGLSPSRPQGQA